MDASATGSRILRLILLLAVISLTAACAIQATPVPRKIALLAPFEGRYRDAGYDALYAARLALSEANLPQIELLPVDDGGTAAHAADRAQALANDPDVIAAIAVGFSAAGDDALVAFADVPLIVVGNWGAQPVGDETFILAHVAEDGRNDALFYNGIRVLNDAPALEWISGAMPPDADFIARYQESDAFAPPPTPLATLVYDALRMAALASANSMTREGAAHYLNQLDYTGLNGEIRFVAHTWAGAPAISYEIVNGEPVALDRPGQ
ncbi:MAG: ABC transporter substrate-binding protein [Anaerolineae bacterium]|nr:ABC transporter substrate-binding protein [Anaerolineae bacterium]